MLFRPWEIEKIKAQQSLGQRGGQNEVEMVTAQREW